MILLDTHVFLWLITNNPKLGKKSLDLINKASLESQLFISKY
jgi:PIN domain nuclease of toxin-antitoxin system